MRYAFVRRYREKFPVTLLCQVLEVSASGFYTRLQRAESLRSQANPRLVVAIKAIQQRSRYTYGSPRIQVELNETG